MTELNPDTPEKPVVVSPSPVSDQVGTGTRDLLLIVAALPALVAVFGTRDITQIVNWIASQQGLSFLGLAIAVGTGAYRQWLARRKHTDLKTVAAAAPDSVGVVK